MQVAGPAMANGSPPASRIFNAAQGTSVTIMERYAATCVPTNISLHHRATGRMARPADRTRRLAGISAPMATHWKLLATPAAATGPERHFRTSTNAHRELSRIFTDAWSAPRETTARATDVTTGRATAMAKATDVTTGKATDVTTGKATGVTTDRATDKVTAQTTAKATGKATDEITGKPPRYRMALICRIAGISGSTALPCSPLANRGMADGDRRPCAISISAPVKLKTTTEDWCARGKAYRSAHSETGGGTTVHQS